MNTTRPVLALLLLLATLLPALPVHADDTPGSGFGQEPTASLPAQLEGVGIVPRPQALLPLDAAFRDEDGKTVTLGDYFHSGRPVILNLMYLRCTALCNPALNSLIQTLNELPPNWTVGREFDVLTVSFDPLETPDLAHQKLQSIFGAYTRSSAASTGWHVLTGDDKNIHALTDTMGFYYKWDKQSNQFAHDVAQIVVSPQGRVTHYLRSVVYDPQTVRLALTESAAGKIGSVSDRFALFACFSFDAATSRYQIAAFKVLRLAGLATIVSLGVFVGALVLLRRRRATPPPSPLVPSP
jgi:protein SCO1/2